MSAVGSILLQRITGCSTDISTAAQQAVERLMKHLQVGTLVPGSWKLYWAPEYYKDPKLEYASLFKVEILLTIQTQAGSLPPQDSRQWFAKEIIASDDLSNQAMLAAVEQATEMMVEHGLNEHDCQSLVLCYVKDNKVYCSFWLFYYAEQEVDCH